VRKEHKTIEMASRKSRCGLGTTSLSVFYRLSSDLRPQRSAPCFFSYFYSTKLLCPGSSTQLSPAQPASSLPDIDDFPGFSNDASDVSSSPPGFHGPPHFGFLTIFLPLRWAQGAVATNALRGWHFEQ
jgi:hypothetical protein